MTHAKKYSPEIRERAFRLVFEQAYYQQQASPAKVAGLR